MLLLLLACALSRPFEGPGFEDGTFVSDHPGPFVVAATYARTAPGHNAPFQDHVGAIDAEIADAEGLVGYALRGEIGGRDNWTMSIWESEEALYTFVISPAHLAAMGEADLLLEDSAFTHWTEADGSALPPTWEEALDRLDRADSAP